MSTSYPVAFPYIGETEAAYAKEAVESTWIGPKGKFIDQFESGFSAYCDRTYGIAVGNGTEAIHVALDAMGVGAGDEVITPSFTFIASVNPIVHLGATPVFAEIDPDSLVMSVESFESCITEKTKAVILVPLYGHPLDYDPILAICKVRGIKVLEDASQAHGSQYKGKMIGGFGDVSCFSMYANKLITTGEGGIVLTDDEALMKQIRCLMNHGRKEHNYIHPELGYNFRMSNVLAAIGCAQFGKIEEILAHRAAIVEWYTEELQSLVDAGKLSFQPVRDWATVNNWFFSIMLPSESMRDALIAGLKAQQVETRPFFYPVHKQPSYTKYHTTTLEITEDISARGMSLPTYHGLTQEDVVTICNRFKKVINDM